MAALSGLSLVSLDKSAVEWMDWDGLLGSIGGGHLQTQTNAGLQVVGLRCMQVRPPLFALPVFEWKYCIICHSMELTSDSERR